MAKKLIRKEKTEHVSVCEFSSSDDTDEYPPHHRRYLDDYGYNY